MNTGKWPTVKDVAKEIAAIHELPHEEAERMISQIPEKVLKIRLNYNNLYEIMEKIDEIRFTKTRKLAEVLGLNAENKRNKTKDNDLLCRIINFPANDSLDYRKKEIHFLLSVAATVIHM